MAFLRARCDTFSQWILFAFIVINELDAAIINYPQLALSVSVTPTIDINAGDKVVYLADISHTKKSFASALDVELRLRAPVYLAYGSYFATNNSLKPDEAIKMNGTMAFKFTNIPKSDHVKLAIDVYVDPYYVLGSRDLVTTTVTASLSYYGANDTCARPSNRWNARSFVRNTRFSFVAGRVCERPLGSLDESQFTASSFYKLSTNTLGQSPHYASFDSDGTAWTPAGAFNKDIHQFLQIDLKRLTRITKIATKGNGNTVPASFVKKYVVHYSRQGVYWFNALTEDNSQEFDGNTDSTLVKVNVLKIPVNARVLRIIPKEWKLKIALQVKLFGCALYQLPDGPQPLGLSSEEIQDSSITVESGNDVNYPPKNARLNFNQSPGAWCTDSSKQTLVVDLGTDHVITKLAVQSRFEVPDNLIKSFYLAYKPEGGVKTYYKGNKLFYGNPVEGTTIKHKLLHPITARHIYIKPHTISGNVNCLRMELYGYKTDNNISSDFVDILNFENGGLSDWVKDGTAFNDQPTFADNLHARTGHVSNHEGSFWVGTKEKRSRSTELPGYEQGNLPTGTLTSPRFLIPSSNLSFLFAGSGTARVELLVDGSVVRAASSQTGSESMTAVTWDVSDIVNYEAVIRLVDDDANGFISFDGLKASYFPIDEHVPVFEKSMLLNPIGDILYLCQLSHSRIPETPVCRTTSDHGSSWEELSRGISSLLGLNTVSGKLYGVSMDQRSVLESTDSGGRDWKQVASSTWSALKGDANFVPALEVPDVPATGLPATDQPSSNSLLKLTSNSGHSYAASALGVHHKPSGGGAWKMFASWLTYSEYPNECASNPCNNGGECSIVDGSVKCACAVGFVGSICDTNVDDCAGQTCSNNGSCIDGINFYYCLCNSTHTGRHCEKEINICRTSPCPQGSTCVAKGTQFCCQCPTGFVGDFCDIATDECSSLPCQNGGLCVDGVNGYECQCRMGHSGTNCEQVKSSAFEVLDTKEVTYDEQTYLVIHAKIPANGRSVLPTWCHEYTALCKSYGKKRPTGCDRSFNHNLTSYQCLTTYDSVMTHKETLGCPPNQRVSTIANMAGYGNASMGNSFGFSQCSEAACSEVLPATGCHSALTCISQNVSNGEVYTLCADPDSNFVVEDKETTTFKGTEYLALYIRPSKSTSRHETWCRDYQRLCESYGKRPTGCGVHFSMTSRCDKLYHSVLPSNNELGCLSLATISNISHDIGNPNTSPHFGFRDCSQCSSVAYTCSALNCFSTAGNVASSTSVTYHTLCTQPLTSFTVLDEAQATVNGTSFLVIKARVPRDRRSTQGNWCQDYATLCDSYGLRPIGCGITQDNRYTSCRDEYGSVRMWEDHDGSCAPQQKIFELANQVGFSSATVSNSFAFHQCTESCSSFLPTSDCEDKGLGCVSLTHNRDVYTACVDLNDTIEVVASEHTTFDGLGFLAIHAKPPTNENMDIATEYAKMCREYGYRPIECTLTPTTPLISALTPSCPPPRRTNLTHQAICSGGSLTTILHKALNVSKNLVFDSTPFLINDDLYAVCQGTDSNYDVISTKTAVHGGMTYLVVQAWLPRHNTSRHGTWCEDYNRMCLDYGYRPVVCKGDTFYTDSSYIMCKDHYDASTVESANCTLNEMVATLATQAGYTNASVSNSFTFTSCNASGCTKDLSQSNSHFMSSVNTCMPVYTMCMAESNAFVVESSRDIKYQGGTYTIIKASISNLVQTRSWCVEYRKACLANHVYPVVISSGHDRTCTSSKKTIWPSRAQEFSGAGCLHELAHIAGYTNASPYTVFAYQNNCHDTCHTDLKQYKGVENGALFIDSDAVVAQDYVTYLLCTKSDSNLDVISALSTTYENRTYKVVKAQLPEDYASKHATWCTDYQRLCVRYYDMRPVAFLTSAQDPTGCIRDHMAVALPRTTKTPSQHVSEIAKHAGFSYATEANSFAFGECDSVCPNILGQNCSGNLQCLTNSQSTVYVLCTDSDSNFIVEEAKYEENKGVPDFHLTIKGRFPGDGVARYGTWCKDYYNVCRSFGMQPSWCALSSKSPGADSCCDVSHDAFVQSTDQAIRTNIKTFKCTQTRNFKALSTAIHDYENHNLTIVKTAILANNSDWCADYSAVCAALGKRAITCYTKGEPEAYGAREKYHFYLYDGACPTVEVLKNITQNASFSDATAQNILGFVDYKQCGKRLTEVSHLPKNVSAIVYAYCSDYSNSHFDVQEVKEAEYAGLPYTVLRARVSSGGQSKGSSWCEDYMKLCEGIGKRPLGCDSQAQVLKESRDCRVLHKAVMVDGMSCPGSEMLANITSQAGFTANSKQCLGLWKCGAKCSQTFQEVWNETDLASDVITVCLGSQSNFRVLETRTTKHNGSPMTVLMATIPGHRLSLHEDWCRDYSMLCQSYGLRPIGCPKAMDTMPEHAQCRDHYQALAMFANGATDCADSASVHVIANSAGFTQANSLNSFMLQSCLRRQCTKIFPTGDGTVSAAFGKLDPQDHVVYTVCASSDSGYEVLGTKSVTISDQDYLVVRANIPTDGASKYETWCRDYQKLCEGFGMQPLTCSKSCQYQYDAMNMADDDGSVSCPVKSGVARIANEAGFDDVSENKSFAFDFCDATSCIAKMPNQDCWQVPYNERVYTVVTKESFRVLVEYKVNKVNQECYIVPVEDPPLVVNGEILTEVYENVTCNSTLDITARGVKVTNTSIMVNQTFMNIVARVRTECKFNSESALARMSGEVTTVCARPSNGTNFRITGMRKVTSSGRDYVVIQASLLSLTSKSKNWCTDYKNLCQSLATSPLACPRDYRFDADYSKCLTDYDAILMSDVEYGCPSNGFVSGMAQSAGYDKSTEINTFTLFGCNDQKCLSTLPANGCGEGLHCLNQELFHDHVYTACVVTNSDSNFHVTEKRSVTISAHAFTALRLLVPSTARSLHRNWCTDYERMCESLGQRPLYYGTAGTASDGCQSKYGAIVYSTRAIYRIARQAGFSEAKVSNSFSLARCDRCSNILETTCHEGLSCLKSTTTDVFTVCGSYTGTGFLPVTTRTMFRGSLVYHVIQAMVASQTSSNGDWGKDYQRLCESYGGTPTGCSQAGAACQNSGSDACNTKYSSVAFPGYESQCNANDVISKLARDAGYLEASRENSFGFASCDSYFSSSLSTLSCHGNMPCLKWRSEDPVVYTTCVQPRLTSLEVLGTKTFPYKDTTYLVIHARLPEDGKSLQANWCSDYESLCEGYGLRPVHGCGTTDQSNGATCSTVYGAYTSNVFSCGDTKTASLIAQRAGYKNALPASTFVLQNCNDCRSELSNGKCDAAMGCISTKLWRREVYTLCVDPPSNFNVLQTAKANHNGIKYLIIEAQLPADGRAKTETWCQDYSEECKHHGKVPVTCTRGDAQWQCTQQYQASIVQNVPCSTASTQVADIARNAGFTQADASNSFILKNCDAQSCSKDLKPGCDQGLSCFPSTPASKVYTMCADAGPTFKVLGTRKLSRFGTVITVVSAALNVATSKTWCKDYTDLCHAIGQSPVAFTSDPDSTSEDILRCRDNFDGVLLPAAIPQSYGDGIHTLAQSIGYTEATYGNTFAFNDCSEASCNSTSSLFNCSESLHCLNGAPIPRTVYGICVEDTPLTNFYVLDDSKTVTAKDAGYLFLKIRIPMHRMSRHGSWCDDYEALCQSYNMRPVTITSNTACPMKYKAVTHTNQDHSSMIALAKQAGYSEAGTTNVYYLQHCNTAECKQKEFRVPHCVSGSCPNSTNEIREFYVPCSSLAESAATNIEVLETRDVWSDSKSFLVSRVKLPSHKRSKQVNWCEEYRAFCSSYNRRPYSSVGLSGMDTSESASCFWGYYATSYQPPVLSLSVVKNAGFISTATCVTGLNSCAFQCRKVLTTVHCPFENCQGALDTSQDYYIICT